jgi:DNA-binding SARP family transcriptional activator
MTDLATPPSATSANVLHAAPPPRLRVQLLGRGRWMLGADLLRLPYAKAQALLLLLLLEPAGLPRERLTDLLWPAQDPATARRNLRHALHLLRRTLGEQRVQSTRELAVLRLLPHDTIDLQRLMAAPAEAPPDLLEDYHGEMLAGFGLPDAPDFMVWLDRQRLAVHASVAACLAQSYAGAQAASDADLAVAVARAQTRIDPWAEAHHLGLMQALADAGREAEALAHWDLVRETFQRDLDAQPGEGLRALAQGLRERAADARPQPQLRPAGTPPAPAGAATPPAQRAGEATEAAALLHVECRALDPRDATALGGIDAVHQALAAGASALGARLRLAGGGAVLLRFDGKPARQGPCAQALRVALEARDAWRAHPAGQRIALRIGLHRGPLLPPAEDRLDPLGHVAGTAVAVAASGLAGDILASPAFAQRVTDQDWVLLPRRTGVYGESPLPVLRLAAADALPARDEYPLLGRASHKAAVMQAWRRARRGQARTLLLEGAPGSGKSRLLRWATQNLPRNDDPWLIDCLPTRREAPAAPLADLLGRLCGLPAGGSAAQALLQVAPALQRIAPDLPAEHLQPLEVLLGLRPEDPEWTPRQRRKDLLDAFVALVRARLARGPLLLVLEDVHWADATTLQAAELAVQRLADAPLLLLASTRPQADGPLPAWPRLAVDPLAPPAAEELACQVLRQQGMAQLAPARLQDIAQRASGNPLFIEALAMAATQRTDSVPHSLEDGLLGSLAGEADARQLARAASVLGEAFSLGLLRTLCAALDDGAYHAAWRQLLRHGLLHRQRDQGRFHHALIRDAVYASLGADQRRALHASAVQAALAEQPDLAESQPLWLARHAEHGVLLDAAIGWYEQAAMQALALAAFTEAASHFARALRLAERLPTSPEQQQRALRLALGHAHATVPLAGYGAEDTRRAFRAVLELGAERAGSDEVFQAHYGLWLGGSSRGGYRQALLYVQRVQRHADTSGQPVHQLQAAYAWGNTHLWLGELDAARRHLEHAIALHGQLAPGALFPRYSEDTGVIARALLAWALWLQGDEAAARRQQQDAIAMAEQLAHVYSLAFALACAARLAVMRGDAAGVAEPVSRLLALAQRHDLALWQAVGGVEQGWLLSVRGQAEGAELAARSVALAAPALPALEVTMLSMQADGLLRSGRRAECAAVVARALACCDHWDDRYMQPELLRLAALCAPDPASATDHLARARAQAVAQGAWAWVRRIDAAAQPQVLPAGG